MTAPSRIVVLVPHEPAADPRVSWVTALCAELAPTDVIAAVWSTAAAGREYDGRVYLERTQVNEAASSSAKACAALLGALSLLGPTERYTARITRLEDIDGPGVGLQGLDHQLGALGRFLASSAYRGAVTSALRRRARATSVVPSVIVCHDLQTLSAGLALKRLFGSRVLYDSHEFWPEASLFAPGWEKAVTAQYERRLATRADAVVTVSPLLARHLERVYGLPRVVSAPNAEPFRPDVVPSSTRPTSRPVRFLLQGQLAPGRGIGALLETWSALETPGAVLLLRAPETPYLDDVRRRFAPALARGAIRIVEPVLEDRLVQAAAEADVGLIPYGGANLNHRLACPNKLSQYMHAGLAILSTELEYVGEVVRRFGCGMTYDSRDPRSLAAAVDALVADLPRLDRLKLAAYEAARAEFNWDVQSRGYRAELERLHSVAA